MSSDVNAAMGATASAGSYIDLDEAFGEPPPEPLRTPPANPLAGMDDAFEPPADVAAEDGARKRSSGASLIDLESYGALENLGTAPSAAGDEGGLTLHPMFFDKDSTEIPAMIRQAEEKAKGKASRWTGGDKG
jgi:hypothetical protein